MKLALWLGLVGCSGLAAGADFCNPDTFEGAYGFQQSGTTTISGLSQPVVSVARIVFDRTGSLSGYSSVNFTGLFLGNPVTGSYELHKDCSISWSLQDDSGAFQHFRGTVEYGSKSIRFRQTDPGSPRAGIMRQTAADCSVGDLRGNYNLNVSGNALEQPGAGIIAGVVSLNGVVEADGAGGLKMTPTGDSPAPTGTFQMEDGCFAQIELSIPVSGGAAATRKFRGIVVNGGSELFGIETDPGTAVTIRLTKRT